MDVKRSAFRWVSVVLLVLVSWGTPVAAQTNDVVERPAELRIALFDDYMPLSGTDLKGEPAGMLVDIWQLWSAKTGIPIRFIRSDFQTTMELVRSDLADIHAGVFRNDARAEWLDFSRALFDSNSHFYFWRDDNVAPTIASLGGRAIGVVAGSFQETYLRESALRFRPRAFSDMEQMLRALARGEIAAFLHEAVPTRSLLVRTGVVGRVGKVPNNVIRNAIHGAIPKDKPNVRAWVDWGLSQISRAEFAQIEKRWIEEENERFFRPQGTDVPLNDAERAWLDANPVIRVGVQRDWAPMSSVPEGTSTPEGMSVAIMRLVNERLGGIITFEADRWVSLMEKTADGRLDAMVDITSTASRAPNYHFTSPYLSIPHVLVTRGSDTTPPAISSMSGRSIAVEEGYSTIYYLRDNYPDIETKIYPDTFTALSAVASGEADGWAGNRAVIKLQIDQNPDLFGDLVIGEQIPSRQSILGVGTGKNDGTLRDIFEKTLATLDPADIRGITEPWLQGTVAGRIPVTRAEQQWLSRNRTTPIRVLALDWPPFHYLEDGIHKGMSIEYINYAFGILGLSPEYVTMPWYEAYEAIRNFEAVDVLPSIASSPSRQEVLEFTEPYLTFPMVIFKRTDEGFINGLDDLRGRTVAVERGFIMDERLQIDYPGITLRHYDTTHDALLAVSVGDANAYVGNLAGGTFHIERHGISNLKVAAPTEYGQDEQSMAVRRDWPELASLLQKVFDQISEEEHAALRGSALAVRFDQGLDIRQVLTYALPIAAVVLIIIAIIVVSNRRLKAQVSEREKAEQQIREREQWFKSLLESAPDATVIWGEDGKIVTVNKQAETMFGIFRNDLIDKNVEILFSDELSPRQLGLRKAGDGESVFRPVNMSSSVRRLDGTMVPVEINLCPIETAEGTMIAASLRDVAKRQQQEAKLKEQDMQLTAALENMSGGMFMMDKDRIIRVFNRKFVEMYMLPNIRVGSTIQDIIKARAERGDYGEGDLKEIMAQRLAGYDDKSITRIEDRLPNGAIIEVYRQPTSDGGMVCITNDITLRKRTEESLAAQTRQLQNLSTKLSRYLSPQIYEAIFAGAADAKVATSRKKLTVFFSDIRNFTATTEEMEPEDMTYLLNDYLTKMTEIALEYGGTIDKYIGDAIMVFFGDPETKGVKEDALAAVRMAVAMQRRMVDLRAKWADMGYRLPFHIRCGVNTGYCNVGNFGSDQRIDYTIIGGQVNLAARLESITEPDGITISYETYSLVRDEFDAEPREPIQVKGISEPVRPYTVKGIFEDWDEKERYIRSNDILGLRLWVDLMRLNDEQRAASIRKLEETLDVLRERKNDAAE